MVVAAILEKAVMLPVTMILCGSQRPLFYSCQLHLVDNMELHSGVCRKTAFVGIFVVYSDC